MRELGSDVPEEASVGGAQGGGREATLRVLAGLFAFPDIIMLTYLLIIGALVWRAAPGPEQALCARVVYLSSAALCLGCFIGRGLTGLSASFRAALYRVAIVGVMLSNYLTLRVLLRLIRPDSVDDALVRIDLLLFGVEPALWLSRFNRRPIVEWFSFFYFSYFFLNLAYMLAVVWCCRLGRMTAEFAIGTALVFSLGQLGYTAVPGYGPIHHLRGSFRGEVDGGFFWSCVWNTVQVGGALKDIFPSLHTAVPLWLTLFACRQARRDARWRWPARVTGFFAANIMISTLLLRWHYGVDVLAGLILAVIAARATPRLVALEERWRRSLGQAGPWCFTASASARAAPPPRPDAPPSAPRGAKALPVSRSFD